MALTLGRGVDHGMPRNWCLAGMPGSGKSTLGERLSEDPRIKVWNPDTVYQEVAREGNVGVLQYLHLERFLQLHPKHPRSSELREELAFAKEFLFGGEQMPNARDRVEIVKRYQRLALEAADFYLKAPTEPELQRFFITVKQQVPYLDLGDFLIRYADSDIQRVIWDELARKRILEDSLKWTHGDVARVSVLESPWMTRRHVRDRWKRLFNQGRVEPGLMMVQAPWDELMQVAVDRQRGGDLRDRNPRTLVEFSHRQSPYDPSEGWSPVIPIPRALAYGVEAIRSRLLNWSPDDQIDDEFPQVLFAPRSRIPFVLDRRTSPD